MGNMECGLSSGKLSDGSLWQIFYMQDPNGESILQKSLVRRKCWLHHPKSPLLLSGPGKYQVTGLAFSPDGTKLAAVNGFGLLHQWRLEDGGLLSVTPTDNKNVVYSPNGSVLAIWHYTAAFYQAQDNQLVYILGNHAGDLRDLEYAPNSRSLAAASMDGKVWWRKVMQDGRSFEHSRLCLLIPGSHMAIIQ